jgi:hypothetical protein
MSDHFHFEELAAQEAGGFLSDEELMELREHAKDCVECRNAHEEFSGLACSGLPLTLSPIREFMDKVNTWPDNGIRGRFLQRARLEGSSSRQTWRDPSGIPGGELASSFQLQPHWSPRL